MSVSTDLHQDEFHTRLKFVRRGLVGCASSGANDNGSQFFITLGRADELTKKHTLFGKVRLSLPCLTFPPFLPGRICMHICTYCPNLGGKYSFNNYLMNQGM